MGGGGLWGLGVLELQLLGLLQLYVLFFVLAHSVEYPAVLDNELGGVDIADHPAATEYLRHFAVDTAKYNAADDHLRCLDLTSKLPALANRHRHRAFDLAFHFPVDVEVGF